MIDSEFENRVGSYLNQMSMMDYPHRPVVPTAECCVAALMLMVLHPKSVADTGPEIRRMMRRLISVLLTIERFADRDMIESLVRWPEGKLMSLLSQLESFEDDADPIVDAEICFWVEVAQTIMMNVHDRQEILRIIESPTEV